ncbi:related to Programmed cell death protein 5 [Ustilago trichophora]|uniref:Related to Programmed cell death protein 5 n=1 Tax=Ustilago trichophora TaxID=86804 RepID=A0A5C3EGY3_9BASI|nr:related to Programmed cell death protein 5 [Ustilago trichophora]
MEDDELQAIRAARMAQLKNGGGGAGGGAGSSGGPGGFGGASGGPGSAGPNAGKNQEDQAAQQEEMKRQMLSRILDAEARERLSRIGLVKPQKARQITDLLIRMAQSGQIRGRITEDQLIGLLDQVDQANSADSGAGKITFTRKKTVQSDDDSDFDL